MLVFGIALGKPLVTICTIWGSFQGPCWNNFEHFFADATKFKKCNLFKRNAWFGRCWASVFASFLLTFRMRFSFCFLDRLFVRFWRIWASKGAPFGSRFSKILQILHITELAEIEARKLVIFGGLFGGAGGRGEACLSLQILQNGEWVYPPAGVRRILRLRPCRRPLWQLRVSWLLACWLGNILIGLVIAGLLGFCCLVFVWLVRFIAVCESFWMLASMSFVWHWPLPRY